MPRYIDADALKERIIKYGCDPCKEYGADRDGIRCPFCNTGNLLAEIDDAPTADVVERKRGKWTEKQVIHADEAKEAVEEWQSCRCSICGHYNTQPYMYYFSEPNYCSFCGASMKEEADNAQLD